MKARTIRHALLVLAALSFAPALRAAQPVDCGRPPASLRGTEVDGSLSADARGRFVPTAGARQLFDYFLTAVGEEPLEAIRTRVFAEAGARLPESAAAEAVRLFDLYLAYLDRVRDLAPLKGRLDAESGLALFADLRREILGREVAEAFFGAEEESDRAALRARLLGERPAAASIDEVMVAPGAAERLAALEHVRAEWRARVTAFRAERRAIEASETSDAARAARVEELLRERFTPTERPRLEALDRIEGN